jgi:hypothetical protein
VPKKYFDCKIGQLWVNFTIGHTFCLIWQNRFQISWHHWLVHFAPRLYGLNMINDQYGTFKNVQKNFPHTVPYKCPDSSFIMLMNARQVSTKKKARSRTKLWTICNMTLCFWLILNVQYQCRSQWWNSERFVVITKLSTSTLHIHFFWKSVVSLLLYWM